MRWGIFVVVSVLGIMLALGGVAYLVVGHAISIGSRAATETITTLSPPQTSAADELIAAPDPADPTIEATPTPTLTTAAVVASSTATPTPSSVPTRTATTSPSETPTTPVSSPSATETQSATPTTTPSAAADHATPSPSATPEPTDNLTSSPNASPQPTETTPTPTPTCISDTAPDFTYHVTDLTQVSQVVSPPTMGGTELKPHGYIDTQRASVPVYTPTAVTLDSGAFYLEGNPGGEYLLIFRASCEVTFRFDHITTPVQSIIEAFPTLQSDTRTSPPATTLSFAAGEQIATTTGTIYGIWDFGVYNSSTSNRYAADPDWNWSDNATTAVCPWDYYSPTMYAQIQALFGSLSGNPPAGEPFCSS